MSAKHAMSVAQRLYEKGYITYMRTDSTALSKQAVEAARAQAVALYGDTAVPPNPRVYRNKTRNAQEAHEAIRPSGEEFRVPSTVASHLDRDELRMYDLIWKRTLASQMSDAKYETTTVTLGVTADGTARGVHGIRHRLHLQGLPRGLRRRPRREAQRRGQGRRPVAARDGDRRRAAAQGRRAQGARHRPQAALHRGEPGQGARREGDRASLDVREHHRCDPRPRLRHQARPGARAQLARLQRRAPARAALRLSRRLRLHGVAGGRSRCDRPRRAGPRRVAEATSTSAPRTRSACATSSRTSARSMRASSTPRRSRTRRRCASASTGRTSTSSIRRLRMPSRAG